MIWAYNAGTGDAVQMIGRASVVTPGTCSPGCQPERQADGSVKCYCWDAHGPRTFLRTVTRSLSGGVWESATQNPVAALIVGGLAAVGGVWAYRRWFR